MAKIAKENGYYVHTSNVHQKRVGCIEVETFWYDHNQELTAKIKIWQCRKNGSVYDNVVFEGSLEDLIKKLTTENQQHITYDEILGGSGIPEIQ